MTALRHFAFCLLCCAASAFATNLEDVQADVKTGLSHWEAGRVDQASHSLKSGAEAATGRSAAAIATRQTALRAVSAILLNAGRFQEALPYIEQLRESMNSVRDREILDHVASMYARCLIGLRRYEQAIAVFDEIRGSQARSAQQHIDAIQLVLPVLASASEESRERFHATLSKGMDDYAMMIAARIVQRERAVAEAGRRDALCTVETDLDLAMHGDFGNEPLHERLTDQCAAD